MLVQEIWTFSDKQSKLYVSWTDNGQWSVFRKMDSTVGCRIDLKEKDVWKKRNPEKYYCSYFGGIMDTRVFEIPINSITYGSSKRTDFFFFKIL